MCSWHPVMLSLPGPFAGLVVQIHVWNQGKGLDTGCWHHGCTLDIFPVTNFNIFSLKEK